MPGPIARGRPIASRWRIRSISRPTRQGRGVGRALLAALIEASTARGYRQMIAVIGDSEQAASIALHAAWASRMSARFPNVGFKFGRWLDTVLMQRALGLGSMVEP